MEALCQLDYPELATAVVSEYLTDYSKDFLAEAARTTYGEAFGGKAGHLAPVEGDTYALELWHGPTCAFKDYALQLMPKLLVEAKKNLSRTEKTLILVATSGDTGKAALDGYHDIPGVEIAVFYPTGGTSEIQRLQMATQEGANVAVYAVRGNFDDAQTGVKKVFGDKAIAARLAERNIRLSSANSINWGRLVPQIVYYFAAYAQLLKAGKIAFGDKVDFCVPTGNFGDILAGYYAKQMGLPVGKLVCASNQNNVLTDFLSTGTYTAKREFYKTTSPSMDILVSSNLERLLYHVTGSDAEVAGLMKSLNETGATRLAFAQNAAGAAQTRIGHGTDLAELHADILFKPVAAFGNLVGVEAVESLVAHLLGDVHHHGVEGVGRILDALFSLVARAPAADRTQSEDGVAVGTVALFEHDNLGAGVMSGDGRDEAGGTGTEHDGVKRFRLGLLGGGFSSGSQTKAGGADGGRAHERALKEAAAAHFFFDHCLLLIEVGKRTVATFKTPTPLLRPIGSMPLRP